MMKHKGHEKENINSFLLKFKAGPLLGQSCSAVLHFFDFPEPLRSLCNCSCSEFSKCKICFIDFSITSVVSTVRWCANVEITHHCSLGFTGEVTTSGLVEGSAAGGAVARAVRRRVCPSIAGYGGLTT